MGVEGGEGGIDSWTYEEKPVRKEAFVRGEIRRHFCRLRMTDDYDAQLVDIRKARRGNADVQVGSR